MQHVYDMIIIGGGPAGYTAALYGARAGLDVIVLEKMAPGGQMTLTGQIDNYPGFEEGIDGFTLGMKMQQGAERFGARTVQAEVLSMDLKFHIKEIRTAEEVYHGKTVVIATGADPRALEVPGEQELRGRGIHYCAHCDGFFYRGKTVVVVGGGNSAVADALYLSRVAEKVILVHRRDELRATKVYQEQLKDAENVEICWNSAVEEIIYEDKVKGVKLRDTQSGEIREISCDGVFVSIGRNPVTGLLEGQLLLDEGGYIVAGENTETSISGVFAAGDVRSKALRQVVTAVADGAVAVHFAEGYLRGEA
ncbi:MAG: thioredoxin-disulfide reductase [Lachnospiraceae bacterium]|nr:thioredoxin-disulfide reductase [Lachnospiraceae bacterium]